MGASFIHPACGGDPRLDERFVAEVFSSNSGLCVDDIYCCGFLKE